MLTQKGLDKQDFKVPVLIPTQTIKGLMIPRIIFLLSFLIASVITVVILQFFAYIIALYVGIGSLILAIILVIREYIELRKQFRFYKFISEEKL